MPFWESVRKCHSHKAIFPLFWIFFFGAAQRAKTVVPPGETTFVRAPRLRRKNSKKWDSSFVGMTLSDRFPKRHPKILKIVGGDRFGVNFFSRNLEGRYGRFCGFLEVYWILNPHFSSFWAVLRILYVIHAYLSNKTGPIKKYWNLVKLWPYLGHFYAPRAVSRSAFRGVTSSIFIRFRKTKYPDTQETKIYQ